MNDVKEVLRTAEATEAPLKLGDTQTSIRFVETHLFDIKVIFNPEEWWRAAMHTAIYFA